MVDATGVEWHRTHPTQLDLWEDVRDLVRTQEEPFGSTSIYAQYRVMKLASETGTKVLLDGQGADEIFGGYVPYLGVHQWELLRSAQWVASARFARQTRATQTVRAAAANALRAAAFDLLPAGALMRARSHAKPHLFGSLRPEFLATYASRARAYKEHNHTRSVNAALVERMTGVGLQGLLKFEDRNSMRWSVESRTPFADDRPLIEYMFTLPGGVKLHNGTTKYLLRRAFDSVLPRTVAERRDKIGFATPELSWLTQSRSQIRKLLDDCSADSYVDVEYLRRNLDAILQSRGNESITDVWPSLNFLLWRQTWFGA